MTGEIMSMCLIVQGYASQLKLAFCMLERGEAAGDL